MLGKLIKHDFKSLSRVLFPTQIAIIGASLLGALGISFSMRISGSRPTGLNVLLGMLSSFMSGIMICAIFAASILVAFIIFQRFYKNLMCDEGYLTFTLPVTTSEILWSKLITAILWTLISEVVIFIGVNIFILLCSDGGNFLNFEAYRQLNRDIYEGFKTFGARLILPILEVLLLMIVVIANRILEVYLALVLGSTVTQKHRILASIGFYFVSVTALYFVMGSSTVNWNINFDTIVPNSAQALQVYDSVMRLVQPIYWFTLALTVAFAAGYFILSHYLLKNKLNLE